MTIPSRSLWFEDALLPEGWARHVRIGISAGRISKIETEAGKTPEDEAEAVALPGLCNVHSHAFQRAMAGLAETRGPEGDDFWTWREIMYRFLGRLTPDDVEAIAAQAYVEMLESGFTRVGEFHYLHNDIDGRAYSDPGELTARIVAAASATAIGMTLLPVFYAHGNFGGAEPVSRQRRFLTTPDGFAKLFEAARNAIRVLPDPVLGVAPHSLRAVTPDELDQILTLIKDDPIHIHAAEQIREVEHCIAWSGRRPAEWLIDRGIDSRWCLIHATHLTPAEVQHLAASGAVAGLCPITEANLGDGIFPAEAYLEKAGRFGIGTDSNILIDAPGELRAIEYAQRLSARRRNILAAKPGDSIGAGLFQVAIDGGAQALGVTGGLRIGGPADIVSLDVDHPSLIGRRRDGLVDGWIFAGGCVRTVWRLGEKVVDSGRHIKRDKIAMNYRTVLRRLLA